MEKKEVKGVPWMGDTGGGSTSARELIGRKWATNVFTRRGEDLKQITAKGEKIVLYAFSEWRIKVSGIGDFGEKPKRRVQVKKIERRIV